MAIAVTVVDTVNQGNATSVAFSFASGTFNTGDLILAVISKDDDIAPTNPSGWTNLTSFSAGASNHLHIAYKEAVLADETATGFTFTTDLEHSLSILYRVTGANTTPTAHSDSTDTGTSAAPATGAATGNDASSVIFAGFMSRDSRSLNQPPALDSTVTTADVESATPSSNSGVTCGYGHWSPGSTTIPALTHSTGASKLWLAYVFEVEPAAAGTTVTATTGALSLASVNTTINAEKAVTATTAALSLAPINATVTAETETRVTATTGALSLSPIAAAITAEIETRVTATTGALSLAPIDAAITVAQATNVTATTGALSLAPIDTTINSEKSITATTGALSLAPVDVVINAEKGVTATTAALTLAPIDVVITVSSAVAVTASTGALALAGFDVDVTVTVPLWTNVTEASSEWSEVTDKAASWTGATAASSEWSEIADKSSSWTPKTGNDTDWS